MKVYRTAVFSIALGMASLGSLALAQGPGGDGPGMHGGAPWDSRRPPMERALHGGGPGGRWWDSPEVAQKLGLTADQQKKMDDIFQQSRLKLIDAHAALQKEETVMEPLIGADQPDESKVLSQIDRVAQARAELEKTNARMLLGLRRVLTPDQWKKLQAERSEHHGPEGMEGRRHGEEGMMHGGHEAPLPPGGPGAPPPLPAPPSPPSQ